MKIKWENLAAWKIEGKGWKECTEHYGRLPRHAGKIISKDLCHMGKSPTGLHVCFETDAVEIRCRWKLGIDQLHEPDFKSCGFSGLALYTEDEKGNWRWAGCGNYVDSMSMNSTLLSGIGKKKRKYLLYFPLRNQLKKIEIGINAEASIKQIVSREKPIVHYGTSIVHGAYASHPGLAASSILGRWLRRTFVNLGFSGGAKMEMEMAELLGELDPALYIIDPLANMDLELIEARAEGFLTILRNLRPKTPIVMVENAPLTCAWLKPDVMQQHAAKWNAYRKVYRNLCRKGHRNIFYVHGKNLFGNDSEVSTDSLHPGDIGLIRMAEILLPIVKKALAAK